MSALPPDICEGLSWIPMFACIPWLEWIKDHQLIFRLIAGGVLVSVYLVYAPYRIYRESEPQHLNEMETRNKELCAAKDQLEADRDRKKIKREELLGSIYEKCMRGNRGWNHPLQSLLESGIIELEADDNEGLLNVCKLLTKNHHPDPFEDIKDFVTPDKRLWFMQKAWLKDLDLNSKKGALDAVLNLFGNRQITQSPANEDPIQ
jgi:hypothetical protein